MESSQLFSPAHADWEARTRSSFALQGVMHYIGARMVDLAPGFCTIELPYRPELAQHDGYFHAGITSTIADSAGGYAAYTLFDAGSNVLTVEFKINLIAPARGDRLVATGRVERIGRTLTVTRVEVDVLAGPRRFACALLQQTLIRVADPERGATLSTSRS